jgi:hypothetical protein
VVHMQGFSVEKLEISGSVIDCMYILLMDK